MNEVKLSSNMSLAMRSAFVSPLNWALSSMPIDAKRSLTVLFTAAMLSSVSI